ncbi:MAG: 3-hydroxyacyl-CoA dehydrogenase/enoyl-CoA hydratase family protein [Deltaproteobacteria bacterium]|nr:3-hydroxyacyl-CoA dehydrogenase/enoyl-CoA hydratase family protein [Deltaproteobacteria bacterium]
MVENIEKAMVIGAGVMGAAIAGHLANAGIPVYLLDIVPDHLSEEENAKGLTLEDSEVRNRYAESAFQRLKKSRPPALFSRSCLSLIEPGNIEDHLERAGDVDWVIEAVIEDLDIKRNIMERIEQVRKPDCLISTNTSGIPVHRIAEGFSEDFRSHFMGTHFFNPPRYLKLLELVPTTDTDPAVVEFMRVFGERRLGKRVVVCKDTPAFIANRVALVTGRSLLNYILDKGYTVEEVDALTGPIIGRPNTATFRLLDLIGMDIGLYVGKNLYEAVPEDPFRDVLQGSGNLLVAQMVRKGLLGNKSGGGFYRQDKMADGSKSYKVLDFDSLEYRQLSPPKIPLIEEAQKITTLRERLAFLMNREDRHGRLLWHDLAFTFSYCSYLIPEASDALYAIDDAVKSGFSHEMGPFEIWDALGVAEISQRMEKDNYPVSSWVKDMLSAGNHTFYREKLGKKMVFDQQPMSYSPIPLDEKHVILRDVKKSTSAVLSSNNGASLLDLGEGVLCLEFHSRANAIDRDVQEILEQAIVRLSGDFKGLVIGNQGKNFCIGANVKDIAKAAEERRWNEIEKFIREGQDQLMRLRYAGKPVVSAPFGMTLGAGAEIALASNGICASSETYMGLVEVGVGLIPAGGGCCELVKRLVSPQSEKQTADIMNALKNAFENILLGKVSTSALEARKMGFLKNDDLIVMNGEHLIHDAARMAVDLHAAGYTVPSPESSLYALGKKGISFLEETTESLKKAGLLSEYDLHIAKELARVLCGGDHSPAQWVDEQHIMDLELEVFLRLCGERKTLERIKHMMKTGKRLKN